jgi:hypothetical protein
LTACVIGDLNTSCTGTGALAVSSGDSVSVAPFRRPVFLGTISILG